MPAIEALVLAAGFSSRMSKNKLLLELAGRKVIQHTLDRVFASNIDGITLVVGHQKEQLQQELVHARVEIVENEYFRQGMSTSIKAGIQYLISRPEKIDAVLILPGDMPLVKPGTINRLLQVYADTSSLAVVPVYQGRRGHPVLFNNRLFDKLLKLSGDTGGREILRKYADHVCRVEVNDPGIHVDIDTWEDYLAVKRRLGFR